MVKRRNSSPKREIHTTNITELTDGEIKRIKRNARLHYELATNSRIEALNRALGTINPDTAMRRMLDMYNREAQREEEIYETQLRAREAIRLREIRDRARERREVVRLRREQEREQARERARLESLKPIIKLDDLKDFVKKWLRGSGRFFTITIKSTRAKVQHQFEFNGLRHFEFWFERLKERETDTAGNFTEGDIDNLFRGHIIIENISGIMGGCNKHKASGKKMKSAFYEYELYNPCSMGNNCFFHCLGYMTGEKIDIKNIRKSNNILTDVPIEINQGYKIMKDLGLDYQIIDFNTNEELDITTKYIVFKENHFYVLTKFTTIKRVDNHTKRGMMYFDFETRPTEEYVMIGSNKSYILKDTICNVYYKDYKSKIYNELHLVTDTPKGNSLQDKDKSSARKLLDFLNSQSKLNKTYHVLAHNGGNFDFYFIMSQFTSLELKDSKPQLRGITVIGLNYRGNLFKDTCCFLTDKLSNLSRDYKVEHGKITDDIDLRGEKMTSSQLIFYKPELSFDEFMDLQNTDPEFWALYDNYCMYDCIALSEVWEKFAKCVNHLLAELIPAVGDNPPVLFKTCYLMKFNTIGSHSKQILIEMNKIYINNKKHDNSYKKELDKFLLEGDGENKYDFVCKFKRGGISESCKMGLHLTGIAGIDVCSQYPSALVYGRCPVGNSYWVDDYDETKFGFYLINNLVFDTEYKFKPVAKSVKGKALDWSTNEFDELYVDSYMLKYIIDNHGLVSFNVVKGLVSNQDMLMEKLFGRYVNTFFGEKKRQDILKKTKSKDYNPALRGTIKLYLNSLTGKLVENPAIHYSLKFDDEAKRQLNGVGVNKDFNEDKRNDWVVAGVMVYSYSKRLLFEYIKCLPNKSNSVIHVETDGIYFSMKEMEQFKMNLSNYEGDYPCSLGKELGNLEIEHETEEGIEAYFLGKKFYYFHDKDKDVKDIFRSKGTRKETYAPDGTIIQLLNKQVYIDYYNGKKIPMNSCMLKKKIWGDKIQISSHYADITLNPEGKVFNVYN